MIRPSEKGLAIIRKHEGLRLEAYQDPGGTWTIGYGHTATATKGMDISPEQAEALLRNDAESAAISLEDSLPVDVARNMPQHQIDALISFIFNVGAGAWNASTMKRKILEDEPPFRIAQEFTRWVYTTLPDGRKVILPGLVQRRRDEAITYQGGAEGNRTVANLLTISFLLYLFGRP